MKHVNEIRDAVRHYFMERVAFSDFVVMLEPMWSVRVYHQEGEALDADEIREQAKTGAVEHLHVVASDVHDQGVTYSLTSGNYSQTFSSFEEAHHEALGLYVDFSDGERDLRQSVVSECMDTLHQMLDAYAEDCLGLRIGEGLTPHDDDDDHKDEYQSIIKAMDVVRYLATNKNLQGVK